MIDASRWDAKPFDKIILPLYVLCFRVAPRPQGTEHTSLSATHAVRLKANKY